MRRSFESLTRLALASALAALLAEISLERIGIRAFKRDAVAP